MSRNCKIALCSGKAIHHTSNLPQLEEKGLSLSFVLTQMFYPNLVDAINTYKRKIEVNLSNSIVREQWHGSKQAIQYDNGVCISRQ